ncbi:hypothetical protein BRC81_14685 [Halobacteriales archaeon QS_1_68_20]|nr:MAG: hypothetical protein BRC81_14685 [Halobacteriales archaeon QS_1_68_20]
MAENVEAGTERGQGEGKSGILTSFLRSVVTPYWLYTILPVSFITLGMLIASIEHGWDWELWGLAAASMWFFDQGFKSVDLSADDLAVRLHSGIQFGVGVAQVLLGVGITTWLALQTTPWVLLLVAINVPLAFAYDMEWFDGLLHDRVHVTGWGNLGIVIGWSPTVLGYLLLAQEVSLGIVVFAVGPLLVLGAVVWPEQDVKPEIYRAVGIEYTRDVDRNVDRFRQRFVYAQLLIAFAFAAMMIGLMIEFVV